MSCFQFFFPVCDDCDWSLISSEVALGPLEVFSTLAVDLVSVFNVAAGPHRKCIYFTASNTHKYNNLLNR